MARFFQSKYSGDQIEKALNTMLSPTSDNKFGVSSVNGQVGAVTNVGMLPIGAIYMSYVDISPATFIEGSTWERITDRVLIGAGNLYTVGSTGGSKDAVVVAHSHPVMINDNGLQPEKVTVGSADSTVAGATLNSTRVFAQTVGVDGTDKNLPPYLAVYIWKRIA